MGVRYGPFFLAVAVVAVVVVGEGTGRLRSLWMRRDRPVSIEFCGGKHGVWRVVGRLFPGLKTVGVGIIIRTIFAYKHFIGQGQYPPTAQHAGKRCKAHQDRLSTLFLRRLWQARICHRARTVRVRNGLQTTAINVARRETNYSLKH